MGAGFHADTRIWSEFGPSVVTLWPRCRRALGLRRVWGSREGGTTMAKVLHEIDHGRESSTHLMLPPNLRPQPAKKELFSRCWRP